MAEAPGHVAAASDSDEDEVVFEKLQVFAGRPPDSILTAEVAPEPYRKRGWSRYTQSLKFLMPIRSYYNNDDVARIDQAGCLSFITYSWVFSYLWSAFRGLIPTDLQWSCSIYDAANVNVTRLEYLWKEEVNNPKNRRGPSLVRVVMRFISTRLIISCVIFFFCLAFGFIGPTCLVRQLIEFAEERKQKPSLSYGFGLVLSLLIVELFRVLSYGATWAMTYRTGVRVRGAVLGLLFKRLMLARGVSQKGVGEIINIYANDGQRIFDAITFLPLVLMGPSVLIGGLIYLLTLLGPCSLFGVAVFVVFDVFQYALGKTMVKYRKLAVEKTEQRVKIMNEILHCMRLIKMNAWEYPFMDKINEVRKAEKRHLRTAAYAQSLAIAAGPVVPVVATIVTFLAYVWIVDKPIAASEAFTAITVFFVMVFGIRMIPYGSRYCAEAVVSLRKIQRFYLAPEIDLSRVPTTNKNHALVIQNGSFAWDSLVSVASENQSAKNDLELQPLSSEEPGAKTVLKNINLVLEKKQLIGICGSVGCGKSSLLQAAIGELVHQEGNVQIGGSLVYCPQEPWIFNATLRENVTYGQTFDQQVYYRVLYACGMSSEINNLPAGDQTQIGERGSTISGGQKARLALARAIYSGRDIYLLDDVLASLDANVSRHVFEYAIKGMLDIKSTLLVTTDAQFLSRCDSVVFMKNGKIVDQGHHDELLTRSDDYAMLCKMSQETRKVLSDGLIEGILHANESMELEQEDEQDAQNELKHTGTRTRTESRTLSGADSLFDIPSAVEDQTMEAEEDFGLSTVSRHVYRKYIVAMGGFISLFIILLTFATNVASAVFAPAWLAYWLRQSESWARSVNETDASMINDPSLGYYATVYGITVAFLIVTSAIKAVTFVNISLKASNAFHGAMFDKVMHATMQWFDTTPTGRIMNRFSKDIDEMDVKIPFNFETFIQNIFQIAAYLGVIAWVFPYFLIACIPLSLLFGLFVACFRAGIRSLKRAENVSRSPLFAHITASIQGRSSIHAYGQTKQCNERLKQLLDANSGALFMFQSAMRWLAVWLDLLVVLVTFATSLMLVTISENVGPAYAGMALAFSIQMSGIFQFAVRMHAEFEAKMTSVERVQFYIDNIDQEPVWYDRDSPASQGWPESGRISFRDVVMKYRDTGAPALKNVSFEVKANENIGIVGRTGSGKSSLGVALFRLYPLTTGSISIDGLDISRVGLHELRAKMSAIPQDPILFAGSIRFNLDPVKVRSDSELWGALEKTHLKQLVSSMDKGLDSEILEGGKNLSTGQRQLLCMARALLRNVKILLLDEATASLDSRTDDMVQQCLRGCFGNCTLLVIAHRLNSVINADKILYMDNGKMVEFESSDALLNDSKSRFFQDVYTNRQSQTVRAGGQEKGHQHHDG